MKKIGPLCNINISGINRNINTIGINVRKGPYFFGLSCMFLIDFLKKNIDIPMSASPSVDLRFYHHFFSTGKKSPRKSPAARNLLFFFSFFQDYA